MINNKKTVNIMIISKLNIICFAGDLLCSQNGNGIEFEFESE